ncbi:MAG: cobalamin biosynthesis protein CbiX [Gammaproteobacteria bacterium]|nr:cobalamin biosynthesis protein CbiX [Gammaproteobacteria bacterium]
MASKRSYLLIDNGSTRAEATLNLRRLAVALGERCGVEVAAVSLQHADRIPAAALGGCAADTLPSFLRSKRAEGVEEFVLVPLFFGSSRALTRFVPDTVGEVVQETGAFRLELGRSLYPLPDGEPRLAGLLCDQVSRTAADHDVQLEQVVLVDHGSPIPEVTAVRQGLAREMRERLGPGISLQEAVMERRAGSEYDFNGALLEERLQAMAREHPHQTVILAMLFFSPGRHAGAGGDIEEICQRVMQAAPGFRVIPTALVGEHEGLVDILADRLREAEGRLGG